MSKEVSESAMPQIVEEDLGQDNESILETENARRLEFNLSESVELILFSQEAGLLHEDQKVIPETLSFSQDSQDP